MNRRKFFAAAGAAIAGIFLLGAKGADDVTGSSAYTYAQKGNAWGRRQSTASPTPTEPDPTPEPTGNPRDSLVSGAYKPDGTNTGVLAGVSLTPYNTSGAVLNITSTSQKLYQNLDIYGKVVISTTGVKFYNCRFRGPVDWPSSQTAVIDCRSSSNIAAVTGSNPWEGVPYFEDCTIYAVRPTNLRDGLMGHFHAKRCNIYNVNDGCGIYNTSSTAGAHAKVEACWIHDLVYWNKDYDANGLVGSHTDGTHNDCIQIQSGGQIHIIGNYLHGRSLMGDDRAYPNLDAYPNSQDGEAATNGTGKSTIFTQTNGDGTGHTNGGGIIVQRNTGIALSNTVIVEKNWFSNGLAGGNLKAGTYIFRNNTFRRNGHYFYTTTSTYPIRPQDTATITSVTGLENPATNKYEDNGELLTQANGGIRI